MTFSFIRIIWERYIVKGALADDSFTQLSYYAFWRSIVFIFSSLFFWGCYFPFILCFYLAFFPTTTLWIGDSLPNAQFLYITYKRFRYILPIPKQQLKNPIISCFLHILYFHHLLRTKAVCLNLDKLSFTVICALCSLVILPLLFAFSLQFFEEILFSSSPSYLHFRSPNTVFFL